MTSTTAVTADQMREIDRIMTEDLHISLFQMMEHAGAHLAQLAIQRFGPRTVTVLAGTGGNGGGGLTAARHLANRGVRVTVVLPRQPAAGTAAAHQLDIARHIGLTVTAEPGEADQPDLVVDALIGYSLTGDPTGPIAELIRWTASQSAPVLSLDLPSGLDATTGRAGDPCVTATATLTLALPKTGLVGSDRVGELYVGDIGVPPDAFRQVRAAEPELFRKTTLVRLR
jgi:NAD(P)H-hydrate epimerase